jgi:ArsR family transcriptional regulator
METKTVAMARKTRSEPAHLPGSKMIAKRTGGSRAEMERRAGEVSELLRTLANRNRLMVACALVEGEYAVGELEEELGIHQPTLSQQLTVLRAAGIVKTRREAKQIFYRLTDDRAARLLQALYVIFCREDNLGPASNFQRAVSRKSR